MQKNSCILPVIWYQDLPDNRPGKNIGRISGQITILCNPSLNNRIPVQGSKHWIKGNMTINFLMVKYFKALKYMNFLIIQFTKEKKMNSFPISWFWLGSGIKDPRSGFSQGLEPDSVFLRPDPQHFFFKNCSVNYGNLLIQFLFN